MRRLGFNAQLPFPSGLDLKSYVSSGLRNKRYEIRREFRIGIGMREETWLSSAVFALLKTLGYTEWAE